MRASLLIVAATLASGCAIEAGAAANRSGQKDLKDWPAELEGRADPVAVWLRTVPRTERGSIVADYESLAQGAAAVLQCDRSTLATFVISDGLVTPEGRFPRLVSTVCDSPSVAASRVFVSAPFRLPDSPDIDPRSLEILAWDPEVRGYRSYATVPVANYPTEVMIEVEPERCQGCHLGPKDLDTTAMPMLPVMNELSSPWQHWNAAPGFNSVDFDIPAETVVAPNYARMAGHGRLAAAPALEQIVRASIDEVNISRLSARRQPASLATIMSLLRPVFCDEQVNYVTASASSGLLPMDLAVRPGLREAFRAANTTPWPWRWFQDTELTVNAGDLGTDAFAMVPVRGAADVDYENRLATVARSLTASQLLRVHALDWKRTLFSPARCGLWTEAKARFAEAPPVLPPDATNQTALSTVFEAIMPIRPSADGRVVALASTGLTSSLAEELAAAQPAAECTDDAAACDIDITTFGALVEAHVLSTDLTRLADDAQSRRCQAQREFSNAPSMPGLELCPRPRGPLRAPRSYGGGRTRPEPWVAPNGE